MASKGPKWPSSWQFRQWTSQCWRTNVPACNNKGYSFPIFTISLCPRFLSMISPRLRQIQRFAKLREHPYPHWSMLGKPHEAATALNTDTGERGERGECSREFCKTLSRKWVPATRGSPSGQRAKNIWFYVQETCKRNVGLFRHLRLLIRFYRGFKT